MMKTKSSLAALCLLSITLPSHADTFVLKDGTTLEAKIISETADEYVLEVQVTKSIKDERKILKADVAKKTADQPDLKAFEAIAKLSPTADLMSEDDYLVQIAAVEKFLKDYPASNKAKEAKAILATLKSESAQVAAGGIKYNGKIVSPGEFKANAYDLDARIEEAKIRRQVEAKEYLAALRAFGDFDRDYRTTLSYGALSPLIKQVIQNQVAEAKQLLLGYDARVKARDVGLQQMAAEDRKISENAIKAEAAELEKRYKTEKDAKQLWVTPSPFNKASLEDTVRVGEAELIRIAAVKTALGVDGGKAYRDLYNAVHNGGNAAAVTAALTAAKTALVAPRYLAPLETAAKGRK
ncbi:MAG: PTPDL family protein [Verrucomicrobiota bacterium]